MRKGFDRRYRQEKNATVKMRMLAVRMYKTPRKDGTSNSLEDVAHFMGMSTSWVGKWVGRYDAEGIKGLYDRARSGAPRTIDHKAMREILKEWRTAKLTGKKLVRLYRERTGQALSYSYARELARKHGFRAKKPRKLHANSASPSTMRAWQADNIELIEGIMGDGFIFSAEDEASFLLDEATNSRFYAPAGKAAATVKSEKRGKLTVAGLVTMPDENGRSHRIHVFKEKSPNSKLFIDLCEKALKRYGLVAMVVDRAPWHQSNAVKKYVEEQGGALRLFVLPRSSSYGNIKEGDWRQAKMDEYLDRHFDSVRELKSALVVVLNIRLSRRRDVLQHLRRSPYKYNERSFKKLSTYTVYD